MFATINSDLSRPRYMARKHWMCSCATAAGMLALALGGPVQAQVAGSGQVVSGTATISPPAVGAPPSTTRVVTTTSQTIIDWTPTDAALTGAPIDFLPVGRTLEFYGTGQYTVLNRFIGRDVNTGLPIPITRQIALNGTVNSYSGPAGATPPQGGNIWFYNAGGILIGASAVFNVGSLVLTANNIDTNGGLFSPTNQIRFRGAAASTSSVEIARGAVINTSNGNAGSSYVALVAPRIIQNGSITNDGSTALVAAEQADIRINNGLFDINVLVGAEGGNVITHGGNTGGPSHVQGDVNSNRVYMVAIPKNDAVTMLVNGQVGYQDALVAQTEPDGAVRLSAGYNIAAGEMDFAPVNATAANITVNDIIFQSSVTARASGAFVGQPIATIPQPGGNLAAVPPPHLGRFNILGDGIFIGDASSTLTINAGRAANVTGNLTINSAGAGGTAGVTSATVAGGQLIVGGNLTIAAGQQAGTGAALTGGDASLSITAGRVQAANVAVRAQVTGGIAGSGIGQTATGGTARITIDGSTSQLAAGEVSADASGRGGGLFIGQNGLETVDNSGDGRGGSATISTLNGGSLTATTSLAAYANGLGETGKLQSGAGTGGSARIIVTGSQSNVTAPLTLIESRGLGGGTTVSNGPLLDSLAGGTGQGNIAELSLNADATAIASLGAVTIDAGGVGGQASGTNAVAGRGQGGAATVNANGGVTVNSTLFSVSAHGVGGTATDPAGTSGVSGSGTGGTILFNVQNAALTGDDLLLSANGFGGANGSAGTGGSVEFRQSGGSVAVGQLEVSAAGIGGDGRTSAKAGTGQGGTTTANLLGGQLNASKLSLDAAGSGGFGAPTDDALATPPPAGAGGDGIGGSAAINLNGTANVTLTILEAGASGLGGLGGDFIMASGNRGNGADGGNGTGGTATINLASGNLTTDLLTADAGGFGGNGGKLNDIGVVSTPSGTGVGGRGGAGLGGNASILYSTPVTVTGQMGSYAVGFGGFGGQNQSGGAGGNGTGGTSAVLVNNIAAGVINPLISTEAQGGKGGLSDTGVPDGSGGNALGGTSRLTVQGANGSAAVNAGLLTAAGSGGNGGGSDASSPTGAGGSGSGGTVELLASGGALTLAPPLSGPIVIRGDGTGGAGATIGNGSGGTVNLLARGGSLTSGTNPVQIAVNGTGAATVGGTVRIASEAGAAGNGTVTLGATTINADGNRAGRINVTAAGNVNFDSLAATTLGSADRTNNDLSTSPAGIFLAPMGGNIAVNGAMSLNSGSSIGIYAQGGGQASAGGAMALIAADQVDIRHDSRTGNLPTLRSGTSLSIQAVNSINGAVGSVLNAGGAMTLGVTNGTISLDHIQSGASITLTSSGAATVGHGEATNDLLAVVGSFATGLNSIITGGYISILSPGAVNLGNSTAGSFISVDGQSIAFNTLNAGTTLTLKATGTANGAADINGATIIAAGDISLTGRTIAVTDAIQGGAGLFANAVGGSVNIRRATTVGGIGIIAAGDIDGEYDAGGDVLLRSGGNINAIARARGGYVDPNGGLTEGYVYVDAAGNIVLTGRAARMAGVRAGGRAAISNFTAGEDLLVRAGTSASLTDVSAGDDMDVQAAGAITTLRTASTGAGGDLRNLTYGPVSPGVNGFQAISAAANGSDIQLVSTGGAITATTLTAADDIALTATSGALTVDGATTTGQGNIGGDSSITTQSSTGQFSFINSFSDVGITTASAANMTGPVRAGRDMTLTAASADFTTLTQPSGNVINNIEAVRDITVTTTGNITGGRHQAGRNLAITAGNIGLLGAITTGNGQMSLTGTSGITAEQIAAAGTLILNAASGAVTISTLDVTGSITATADSILISDGDMLNFARLDTDVGGARVSASNGITVTAGTVATLANLRVTGDAPLNVASLNARDFVLSTFGNMTLGNVTAAQSFNSMVRRMLTVDGVATGREISFDSGDITIGANGRIGTIGTTMALSLTNADNRVQTFIGGTGTRNGYHIDAAEMARTFGSEIRIVAGEVGVSNEAFIAAAPGSGIGTIASINSNRQPDVIIDDFTMTAGSATSNLGANGSLTIETPGKARVIGDVSLTGMTDANRFNLNAFNALEVILGQGTIRLTGADANMPGGLLSLDSDDIIVATQAAIADVGTATTTDAIDDRLALSDGISSNDGALFAAGIDIFADDGFYVQNSGASDAIADRRGLSFGALGFNIETGSSATRIIINGQHLGPTGAVTGLDTIPLININGIAAGSTGSTPGQGGTGTPGGSSSSISTSFDPLSTINGCLIVNVAACSPLAHDNGSAFPIQDIIDENDDENARDGQGGSSIVAPLITLRDLDPASGEPLLDDPVTGAGNDDLWVPPAD